MRIGILGCGYVGEAAALHWTKGGHVLSATTRTQNRIPYLSHFIDHVYLLESLSLAHFLSELDILLISVAPDKASDYASAYLRTAQNVAKELLICPNLKQILYTSSLSVYGDHEGQWIDETALAIPSNENTKILLETEKTLMEIARSNLKVCILRLGEIYGPGREIENRLRRMLHQPFPGDGSSFTNLIHLEDIVGALDFALKHQLQGIYNLCSDEHIPRKQFYEQICRRENLPQVQWDSTRTGAHQGRRRVLSQKLKKEGFVFLHPYYT